MTRFNIRDVSEETNQRLRVQAALTGMSREAYIRWLLDSAKMNPKGASHIKLEKPLACGKLTGVKTCGNEASVALGWKGPIPGQWSLLPICKECATTIAHLYDLKI